VLVLLIAAAVTGAAVLLTSDDEGGNGPPSAGTAAPPRRAPPTHASRPESRGETQRTKPNGTRRQVHQAVGVSQAASLDASQRRVVRVVRGYVAALNAGNGGRACSLFVPGALAGVDFPRDRGSCARSLSASVGYRDPRGFPVFKRSRIARILAVAISGPQARVTATTVTRFADNREPSVEDDVIYLQERNRRWSIAKPSATLYRAIGVGNIPTRVLAPP
jgi:hypothetical protein